MTLDELDPVWPLWLVVLRLLDAHPEGVSVTRVASLVNRVTDGRYARPASVATMLRRLRDAGVVSARNEETGRRIPAKVHTLTLDGANLLKLGETRVVQMLSSTARADTKRRTKHVTQS